MSPLLGKVLARAGASPVHEVRLRQRGEMRLAPGRPWMRFVADQVIAATHPSFRWVATIRLAPLLTMRVVDACEDGRGRLEGRLWGILRVVRATGPDIDRGELLRYVAELPWCPHALRANAALSVREEGDDLVAGARGVEARLTVDPGGDIVAAAAMRPRTVGGASVDTPWRGTFSDHGDLGGFRGPRRGVAAWQLEDGPFEYWRGEIVEAAGFSAAAGA